MLIAVLWGLAEATLFFVVPDVWLTYVAVRRGLKPAVFASLAALGGALVGGMLMYGWSDADLETARTALDRVPAINASTIDFARTALRESGTIAVFFGPLNGVPYKIYAVEAAAAGVGLVRFLLVSAPARMIRFGISVVLAWAIATPLSRRIGEKRCLWILAAFWIVTYAVYFAQRGF